jgi:hypothetical protein
VLTGRALHRLRIGGNLVGSHLGVVEISNAQRHADLKVRRRHAHADLREDRRFEQLEKNRDGLRIGNRVEEDELRDPPLQPRLRLEGEEERNPSAIGVSDDGEVAEIPVKNELDQELGLIARGVAFVEGLIGFAEAFHVHGDHAVIAGEIRQYMPPGERVGAEAVDEKDRRAGTPLDRK